MKICFYKIIVVSTAIISGIIISIAFSGQSGLVEEVGKNHPERVLRCNFYDEKAFMKSVESTKNNNAGGERLILGGITPHHLLAGSMIASFFKTVSKSRPDVIVIIAPNHKGIGVKKIQTGEWDWETPFGLLKCDTRGGEVLLSSGQAGSSFDLLEKEHSIAGLIPYIKYYMPNTKVLPVLLHGSMDTGNAVRLGSSLRTIYKNKKVVYVASVDFSHYLPMEEADKKDVETLNTIESGNIKKLAIYGNDHLDSPQSIITLLSAINYPEGSGIEILQHSNAARIANLKSDSTTSYFTILYVKRSQKTN